MLMCVHSYLLARLRGFIRYKVIFIALLCVCSYLLARLRGLIRWAKTYLLRFVVFVGEGHTACQLAHLNMGAWAHGHVCGEGYTIFYTTGYQSYSSISINISFFFQYYNINTWTGEVLTSILIPILGWVKY